MAKRPMLGLAMGLAGASALATALGPMTLGIVWLAAGLGLLWAGRRRPSFPRLWIVPGWVLLGIIGLRAFPVETQPIATGQFNGRWEGSGRALGELVGHPIPVQLPMGFARDGDRLALHASALRIQNASPPDEPTTDHSWMVEPAQIRRTQSASPNLLQTPQWILELRERIARRLQDLEDDRNRGLAQALLLGKSEAVDPGLKDRFTRTGTRHLLALSGLHVGLMWWLFMRPICQGLAGLLSIRVLGRALPLGVQARLPAILQVMALAFFLPILGGGTPALRASLALGMADCARQVISAPGAPPGAGRRVDPLSIWSLALALELLWRPESVTSVSLQLSYVATLGLIVFWAPLHALCVAQGPRIFPAFLWESNSLGKPRHPAFPWLVRMSANFLVGGVLASVIATCSTLPFIWIHFGEWSPMGVIGTLVLLPLVALGLLLGWTYAVFPWWMPKAWAAWPFARIPEHLLAFDDWALTPHLLPPHAAWLILLAFTLLCCAMGLAVKNRNGSIQNWARRGTLATCAFLLFPRTSPPAHMTLHVCDVGHGTAILAQMPCGRDWLFDAGSRDRKGVASRAVLPLVRKLGITRLNVVISHGDRDHQAALERIASRLGVQSYTGPGPLFDHDESMSFSDAGLDWDVGTGSLETTACPLGRCTIRILRGLDESGNEGSRNLLLECDGRSVLLCGDAEDLGLTNVIPELKQHAPFAALLAPHHGSEQENLGCLISHTRPGEIWFSASERSPLAQNWPYSNTTTRWTARDGGWSVEFKPRKESPGNLSYRAP